MKEKIKFIVENINMYALMIMIFIFSFKAGLSSNPLDFSWAYAVNKVSYDRIYNWGGDVSFTYGPLAFMKIPINIGHFPEASIIFKSLLLMLLFFGVIYLVKSGIPKFKINLFLLITSFCLVLYFVDILDFMILFLTVLTWFANDRRFSSADNYSLNNKAFWFFWTALSLYSAFLIFIKFNLGISSISSLIFAFIGITLYNYKFMEPKNKNLDKNILLRDTAIQLLIPCVIFISMSIVMNKLYFGGFNNMIVWLKHSYLIASAFSEAMAKRWEIEYNIFVYIAIFICLIILHQIIKLIKMKDKTALLYIVILPMLFFVFKSGITRSDYGHLCSFYVFITLGAPLLYIVDKNFSYKKLLLILLLSISYIVMHVHYSPKSSIFTYNSKLNHCTEKFISDKYKLDKKWLNEINEKKVQFLPQSFVYYMNNDLNYHFNPILQLYSVYSDKLDNISAESYSNRIKSPDYIIVHDFKSIDNRNMLWDNPSTWLAIKENYKVIDAKSDMLLLKKRQKAETIEIKTYKEGVYRLKEPIVVPIDAKYAQIDIKLNPLGKIMSFIFRIRPLEVRIIKNKNQKCKVIRSVLSNSIYVDNYAENNADLLRWFDDNPTDNNIKGIKFNSKGRIFYNPQIKIKWQK